MLDIRYCFQNAPTGAYIEEFPDLLHFSNFCHKLLCQLLIFYKIISGIRVNVTNLWL